MLTKADYHIKNGYYPSYLYTEISEVNKKYNQIELKMTLNKMEGTLLYLIDIYNNQLIISLYDDVKERMKIEFRGEENYLSLSELCGCLACKYKSIELSITISNEINIQCNQWPIKSFIYLNEIKLNKAYPSIKTSDKFQGQIWLVNTPAHGEYYPNNAQLAGCIHEISFNNQLLNMTISGSEITTKCPIKCINNICNFGVCYETFDTDPICDCNDTFWNGPYCNSSGIDVMNSNSRNYPDTIQLKFIKITWQADSENIFGIENKNISVITQAEKTHLYILYHDKIELFNSTKIITDKYQPNQISSLHLLFDTKFIRITFNQFGINSTKITETSVSKDLSEVHFASISIPNRPKLIDFVYKFSQTEYKWRPLRVKFNRQVSPVNARFIPNYSYSNISKNGCESVVKDVIIGIETFGIILIFLLLFWNFTLWKLRGKKRRKNIPQSQDSKTHFHIGKSYKVFKKTRKDSHF